MELNDILDLNKKIKVAQNYLSKNFKDFINKDLNEFVNLYAIFDTSKYSIFFEQKILHDKNLIKLKGSSLPSDAFCNKTQRAIEIKHCLINQNKNNFYIKGLRLKHNDLYYIYLNNHEKIIEITISKNEFIKEFGERKEFEIYYSNKDNTNYQKFLKYKTKEWNLI